MRLNKDSWHYNMWVKSFAYNEMIPQSTDLCRYCHKVFWQLVLRAFMVFTAGFACCFGAWLFLYKGLYMNTGTTLIVVSVIVTVVGGLILYSRWLNGDRRNRTEPKTLVGKYMRASKDRVCPLVEFDR